MKEKNGTNCIISRETSNLTSPLERKSERVGRVEEEF
jgi:hypothetical protein